MRDIRTLIHEKAARRVLNRLLPEYMRIPLDRMQKLHPAPMEGTRNFAINTASGFWRCDSSLGVCSGDLAVLVEKAEGIPIHQARKKCFFEPVKPIEQQVSEGLWELGDWKAWREVTISYGLKHSDLLADLHRRDSGSHNVTCPGCGEEAVVFTPTWYGHCDICGTLRPLHLVALATSDDRPEPGCSLEAEAEHLDGLLRTARRAILEFHQKGKH